LLHLVHLLLLHLLLLHMLLLHLLVLHLLLLHLLMLRLLLLHTKYPRKLIPEMDEESIFKVTPVLPLRPVDSLIPAALPKKVACQLPPRG
jgi:hypothetical protein